MVVAKLVVLLGMVSCMSANAGLSDKRNGEGQNATQDEKSNSNGKPELEVSGSAAVHGVFSNPDVTYSSPKAQRADTDSTTPRIAGGEANIAFKARGELKNGVRYGAVLDIDAMKGDTGVDKMYVLFERDNVGTFQVGNVKGPEATMLCGGQQLIGGTCGVDGTITRDMDYATGVISPVYMIGYSSKSTKIVYYTPKIFGGFQIGVAYTPDTKHVGHDDKNRHTGDTSTGNDKGLFMKGKDDKQRPSGKNHLSIGIRHQYEFKNGWGTKIAMVYLRETVRRVKVTHVATTDTSPIAATEVPLRNTKAYHITATVSYKNIEVGGGYLNNGKSRMPTKDAIYENDRIGGCLATAESNAGHAWNIGARYTIGDWKIAVVYHNTKRKVASGQRTRGQMITGSAEYKVCDGLLLFAEIDRVMTHSCDKACAIRDASASGKSSADITEEDKVAIKDQRCLLLAIGAKVSF
jgi:predicted porin